MSYLTNPYRYAVAGLSDTDWTGAGSNTSVSDGTVTAITSDVNYRKGGTQISSNSFEFKVVFAPNASAAKFGYGISDDATPSDSDNISWGFEWYAGAVSPNKIVRIKEDGSTKATWSNWTTDDYYTIIATDGEIVYTHYNSSDVEQDTYTSLAAFDFTAQSYFISTMQGGASAGSNVYSQDNL